MFEPLGVKPATALAAAIGAMISLRYLDELGPRKRVTAVCCGFFASVYITPVLVNSLHAYFEWQWVLTQQGESGFAFLVGLAGLALMGALLKFIKVDLVEVIKGRFNGSRT